MKAGVQRADLNRIADGPVGEVCLDNFGETMYGGCRRLDGKHRCPVFGADSQGRVPLPIEYLSSPGFEEVDVG